MERFYIRQQLCQQRNGFLTLLSCVQHMDAVQRRFQLLQLGIHGRDLLIPLWRQMLAFCLYGWSAALQLRPAFRHAVIEIILPADHIFLVADLQAELRDERNLGFQQRAHISALESRCRKAEKLLKMLPPEVVREVEKREKQRM